MLRLFSLILLPKSSVTNRPVKTWHFLPRPKFSAKRRQSAPELDCGGPTFLLPGLATNAKLFLWLLPGTSIDQGLLSLQVLGLFTNSWKNENNTKIVLVTIPVNYFIITTLTPHHRSTFQKHQALKATNTCKHLVRCETFCTNLSRNRLNEIIDCCKQVCTFQ